MKNISANKKLLYKRAYIAYQELVDFYADLSGEVLEPPVSANIFFALEDEPEVKAFKKFVDSVIKNHNELFCKSNVTEKTRDLNAAVKLILDTGGHD